MLSTTISAWSIFIALVGISLNVFFTKPYIGIARLADETKEKLHNRKEKVGKIANILILFGTLGQLASIIIR